LFPVPIYTCPLIQRARWPSMKLSNRDSLPKARGGNGIVSLKANRGEPDLVIEEKAFSAPALRGLIDDWLVPAIVERIIRDLLRNEE
jgi:hypothetical protein